MTAYILKSSICMVVMFGLYWFILRKEKLFVFNRYYLILSVLFSLAIPFFSFTVNSGNKEISRVIMTAINSIPEMDPVQDLTIADGVGPYKELQASDAGSYAPFDISRALIFLYLSGAILLLIRFCWNIFTIFKQIRISEIINHDWYKLALVDHPVNPYSFLGTIVLNKNDYLQKRITEDLLRHELEHIRQSHSRDVIFFEIICIIYWFNPVVILLSRAARINHEYLADNAVTRNSSDIKTYANELISFIANRISMPLTSGFNPSLTRKRLLMLNRRNPGIIINGIRITGTLCSATLLFMILSFKPVFSNPQVNGSELMQDAGKKIFPPPEIREVNFLDSHFKAANALVVMDGLILGKNGKLTMDQDKIKSIRILKDKEATDKYGKKGKDGVVEIILYGNKTASQMADTSKYSTSIHIKRDRNNGESTDIPISNLHSISVWTIYHTPGTIHKKDHRSVSFTTRDYFSVRGKVVQPNGKPLPGVLVTATDNPARVRSDKDGNFLIRDVKEDGMLEFSHNGFGTYILSTLFEVAFNEELTITLEKESKGR